MFPRTLIYIISFQLICLQVAAGLSGCSLSPAYQRPTVQIPVRFDGLAVAPKKEQPLKIEFSPEEKLFIESFSARVDLKPLVAAALARDQTFRLSILRVEQSRAQYQSERAARFPELAAFGEYRRQSFRSESFNEKYGQHYAAFSVGVESWDLDLFGRLASMSEAARQRYLGTEYGHVAARGVLIAEVLRAYANERAAELAEKIFSRADSDCGVLLEFARRQRELEELSEDAFAQRSTDASRMHAQALEAARDYREARRALLEIVGYDFNVPNADVLELAEQASSVPVDSLRDVNSDVLLRRPDILQAESELKALDANIGAARAAFFPSVRLSTAVGSASDNLKGLFDRATGMWMFTPQISIPIFDFWGRMANLEIAKNQKEAGVAMYEMTIRGAFREVAGALESRGPLLLEEFNSRAFAVRDDQRISRMQARVWREYEDHALFFSERIRSAQFQLEHVKAARALILNRIELFHAFYGTSSAVNLDE